MKRWRIGLVGYGFITGKGHVPALLGREDVEIVAVADICEARRREAQRALPRARIYDSYLDLLSQEKDLDILDIGTPPCDHAAIAVSALQQGLHVLCEKPLATSQAEAAQMLKAAAQAQRVLYPCHNYKHAPVVKYLQEQVSSGKLGEITGATLQTFRNTHAKGVIEWQTDWRRSRKWSGGGIAMDHGSHSFYLTFSWLSGFPKSVSARAYIRNQQWDTEDNLAVVLDFPGSKPVHCTLSWTAGMRKVVYSVQGTEGAVMVNDDEVELSLGFPHTGSHSGSGNHRVERHTLASDWMDASHAKWFLSMFDEFLRAIKNRDFLNREIQESYACVSIIEACYRSSAQGGRSVDLDLSLLEELKS
jgi:predicted dehydrogenase